MPATPSLDLRLLGSFRVFVDGEVLDDSSWSRRKSKSLLKILALERTHQLHREQLMELLWPEMDGESALNNLHKAIHAARRALEPSLDSGAASRFLQTQNQLVILQSDDGLQIDADFFEAAASQAIDQSTVASLSAAAALYTGDLLEEDRYEDWATIRREQLRTLFENVLDRLAAAQQQSGQSTLAKETLERLLALAPTNEDASRRLISIHLSTGQRHLALNQYKLCRQALQSQLGVEPEPATELLYQQALAGAAPVPTPVSASIVSAAKPRYLIWTIAIAILVAAFLWLRFPNSNRDSSSIHSIAVFPLTSGGDLKDVGYISDGITENLINSLSQLPNLRVMARSTVFAYREKKTDPRVAGRELRVAAVITGSISQVGNQIEVDAELVDVSDGARLWGQRFTVPSRDLATVQTLLGYQIAAALKQKLSIAPKGSPTSVPEAYKSFLLARYFFNQRSREGFNKAIQNFEQAIALDPNFAAAYSGLANASGLRAFSDSSPKPGFEKARQAATRALELDPNLAEAHTSNAMIAALYDWNWAHAEASFRRAIELNPGYSTAHHWYAIHLAAMGQFDAARVELGKALELDPLSPIIHSNSGYPDYYQSRFTPAIAAYRQALELNPGFAVAHQDLATIFHLQGNTKEQMEQIVVSLSDEGDFGLAGAIEQANAKSGHLSALKLWLATLQKRSKDRYTSPMEFARIHLFLGEKSAALNALDLAFNERSASLVYLNVDPFFAPLRSDPRFQSLLFRIGLSARK